MKYSEFNKLIDYYHQCVIEDREMKITEYVPPQNSRHKARYLHLEDEEFSLFRQKKPLKQNPISRISKQLGINDKKQNDTEFLIGYPILHDLKHEKIIPVFLFLITGYRPSECDIDFEEIHLNSIFFERTEIDLSVFRVEVNKIIEDYENDDIPETIIDSLLNLLSQHILINKNVEELGQIYDSTACYFVHERTNFTKGLENELKNFSSNLLTNNDLISKSSIKYLFQSNEKVFKNSEIRMFTSLNHSQLLAVKTALTEGVTYIQGPPGTGKSDVVLNIILNAFLNNRRVLFSSKNHKAIETVLQRIDQYLKDYTIILKSGRSDRSGVGSQLINKLEQILNQSKNIFSPIKQKELISLIEKSEKLHAEISELNELQVFILENNLKTSELYRKYIKGNLLYNRIFSGLNRKSNIHSAAMLSPRIKRMTMYLRLLKDCEGLDRLEELTSQIFKEREELIEINKSILSLMVNKTYSFFTQDEKKLIEEYKNLLRLWLDGGFPDGNARKNFKDKFKTVSKLLRVWSITNLSISGQIPLETDLFDYVIVDEASQCDIPSSLCLMARTKCFIVVGDEMQLTHITNISTKRSGQLLKNHGLVTIDVGEWEYCNSSILNLIKSRTRNTHGESGIMLDEHFRSKKEIINFSNSKFYGDKLKIRTDYMKLNSFDGVAPVTWVNASGSYKTDNFKLFVPEEIEECFKIYLKLIENPSVESIGILSPFRLQVEKLREKFKYYEKDSKNGKDLLIDTIHRFQGDEKDVIIFSLGVSNPIKTENRIKNNNEYFYQGNKNLLNVGLTRAKSNLLIVGDKQFCHNSKVWTLSELANYVDSLTKEVSPNETNEERILFEELAKLGQKPFSQYPFFSYRLDIAIINETNKICIEVDGSQHEGAVPGERNSYDNVRDYTLITKGWKVLRFWNFEVWHDLEGCIKKVQEALV